MAVYRVVIGKDVRKKDLAKIPQSDLARIVKRIKALAGDPYPHDSIKLTGRYERRIRQGKYRILYVVEADIVTVFVVKIGHRSDVYD